MIELEGLFIGACTEDVMMRIEKMPVRNQRIAAKAFTRCCGGVAANAAAAFRFLGGKGGVITAIGDDDSGRFIRGDLDRQGYDYLQVHTLAGCASSISTIQVEDGGHRSITHFGGSISKLTFDMIDLDALLNAKIVHMGVLNGECMIEAAHAVKKRGRGLVSIDGGNLEKDLVEELLPYCDIYIPDDVTAARTYQMTPEEACRYFREKGVSVAAVTAGGEGSYALDAKGAYHIPAMKVNVVDTTAAGDNFHGAFLYAFSRNRSTLDCLKFAGTFASLTCEAMGGRAGMPSLEKVESLIR